MRSVEVRIEPTLPEIVTEAARLELILVNLLSNAIKYCDARKTLRYVEVISPPSAVSDTCIVYGVQPRCTAAAVCCMD